MGYKEISGFSQVFWQHKKLKSREVDTSQAIILTPNQNTLPETTNSFSAIDTEDKDEHWDVWEEAVQTQKGSSKTPDAPAQSVATKQLVPITNPKQYAPPSFKAQPVDPPRQSQRLQQKAIGGKGAGKDKGKSTIASSTSLITSVDTLVKNFLFDQSLDSDIVKLFESCGFSLGKNKLIRKHVVERFRSLIRIDS
jgi:hypothetical protein